MQYDENAEKYGYEGEMTTIECDKLQAYKGDVTIPVYGTIADADVYLKKDVDEAIAELKAKLEDVQASMYCDVVDANMENRRLKRALWLARAERARTEQCYENYSFYIHRHQKTMYGGTYRQYIAWLEKWDEVERKCRAKAEEYK